MPHFSLIPGPHQPNACPDPISLKALNQSTAFYTPPLSQLSSWTAVCLPHSFLYSFSDIFTSAAYVSYPKSKSSHITPCLKLKCCCICLQYKHKTPDPDPYDPARFYHYGCAQHTLPCRAPVSPFLGPCPREILSLPGTPAVFPSPITKESTFTLPR